MSFTGKCLCGQASYRVSSEPVATAICHCRNCQRQAGSAFSIIVAVPSHTVELEGELKTYNDTADSGAILYRSFCPECGSPFFSVLSDAPQMTFIKAGTLDDVSALKPQFQIWCKSAQPWIKLDPDLVQFKENAPVPS
jgi:hypothetical protein